MTTTRRREKREAIVFGIYLSLATRGGERRAPGLQTNGGAEWPAGPTRLAPHTTVSTSGVAAALRCPPFSPLLGPEIGRSSVSDGGDAADGGTAGRVALTGILALASLGGLVSGRFLLAQGSPFHKRPVPVLGEHG
ncbi:hypothetical protein C4D60_Mb10t02110 [Musa balbisiana]|uniref:Uncharacterized protein n=1 Tax=Musa balbisiana TaxID=52838 RepID=A0A4S8IU66_MUSBA|nr:hypothetical protein C4D60_Mb10t02110 [Musa balbisiana]